MKLTKADLLLAAKAAKLWPKGNFGAWTIDGSPGLFASFKIGKLEPGYA